MDIIKFVNKVAPSFDSLRDEIKELRRSYPKKTNDELAEIYGKRLRLKYTSVGVAGALPGIVPGFGTAVQISIEVGTVSADLLFMMRWMAACCYGIALIYDKDIENEFNQEFVKILGLWCRVIIPAKEAVSRVATKVAVAQFNKRVSGKILQKINQKVGTTILTKYGTKRGGIALGKLIPFGVGAVVSGGFNYITMNKFKNSALKYFKVNDTDEFIIAE